VKIAVELISHGAMPMGRLASHKLPLDEVFRAYELMERGEALRVVLCP
jgi:Zn-dependent alcohol dehydrogenase